MMHDFWQEHERIAVIGSRFGVPPVDPTPQQVAMHAAGREWMKQWIESLNVDKTVIVTGRCPSGADDWARTSAERCGITVVDVPANWAKHGRQAGFRRNPVVVALGDKVLALWDGESNGTKDGIKWAIKLGIPIRVMQVTWCASDGKATVERVNLAM